MFLKLRKNISITFFFFVLLFLYQCKQGHNEKEFMVIKPNSSLKISQQISKIQLSLFVDSISYIPLQQDENNMIGKITKLLLLKDKLVVIDLSLVKGIFIFDKNGKFLKKIARGGAPFEPMSIEDVAVDYERDEIYAYSGAQAKIFIYNGGGNFKKSIKIPNGYFSNFEKIGTDFLFYREIEKLEPNEIVENARLCLIDTLGKLKKSWYKNVRNKNFKTVTSEIFFKKFNASGNIFFESPNIGIDTLYQMNNKSFEINPVIVFDFGKREDDFQKKYFSIKSSEEYLDFISKNPLTFDLPIITDSWVVGGYSTYGAIYNYLYNTKNRKTISGAGFNNNIDSIPISFNPYSFTQSNTIYSTVELSYLKNEYEASKNEGNKNLSLSQKQKEFLAISDKDMGAIIIAKLHTKK